MAEDLPDPSPSEARALVVGLGLLWACWGISTTYFVDGLWVGLVAFMGGFAAGGWAFVGGIYSVVARAEGVDVRDFMFGSRGAPWTRQARSRQRRRRRVTGPRYLRRAADVLGWNGSAVLAVLGALLLIDAVAAVWLFTSAPSS